MPELMRIRSKSILVLVICFTTLVEVSGQGFSETIKNNLELTGDFRFRLEQDWNSRKADGTYRADRIRMRYRMRFGASYTHNDWAKLGFRLRTGTQLDQQDPHITLGAKGGEFQTLRVGFEKLYFQAQHKFFKIWVGKNTFPFFKHDEMFWNDNVFPEGIAGQLNFAFDSMLVSSLKVNAGHFIGVSAGRSFSEDQFFQGLQVIPGFFNDRFVLPVGIFYFNKASNIPDGKGSYFVKYSILNLAPMVVVLEKPRISIGFDFYANLADLNSNQNIPDNLVGQKNGYNFNVKFGQLKDKGDWMVHLYYSRMQKYSAVDYYAGNDWARWDYSGEDASGARLTNMHGMELRVGYLVAPKFDLIFRGFLVEQLVAEGDFKETGSRVRIDMNIGF